MQRVDLVTLTLSSAAEQLDETGEKGVFVCTHKQQAKSTQEHGRAEKERYDQPRAQDV